MFPAVGMGFLMLGDDRKTDAVPRSFPAKNHLHRGYPVTGAKGNRYLTVGKIIRIFDAWGP